MLSSRPSNDGGTAINFYAVYRANATIQPSAITQTVKEDVKTIANYNVTEVAPVTRKLKITSI